MPITRKSMNAAAQRVKIVDDPDHPGQPKDISPLIVVRSRAEVDGLALQALAVKAYAKETKDGELDAYCLAVLDVVGWLTDAKAQRPWLAKGESIDES